MSLYIWVLIAAAISCDTPLSKKEGHQKPSHLIRIGEITLQSKLLSFPSDKNGEVADSTQDQIVYFNVRLEKREGLQLEKEKLLYLDFDMQKDFFLEADNELIYPVFCQRIPNGKANSYEYAVAFECDNWKEKVLRLSYNDQIFGVGKVAFIYNPEDFKKLPIKS